MRANTVISYVKENPIKATLEMQWRPHFTFRNNHRDILLQILVLFGLFGKTDALENLNSNELVHDKLFDLFDEAAASVDPENAEQNATLKKLKKLIHAYAELNGVDLKRKSQRKIINLKKLALAERSSDVDHLSLKLKQQYAVVKDIDPHVTLSQRNVRKKAKSRINRASLFISVIVAIGEGMIAAAFAAAALPFLPALLAIGIPAILCNYFLFRGASFSVMKEIYFGKSTDDKKTKTLKGASTFFSAMAGLTYGFLSYGSASIAFGHLFFGLTAAAAMAAPPVGLIVIALVISVVTAIAVTTLYDYALRKMIDNGIKKTLLKLKDDFIDFFKPDNKKSFSELSLKQKVQHVAKKSLQSVLHFIFYSIAVAVSAVVILAIMPIMRHKATSILHGTFRIAHKTAELVSKAITIAMGSIVNGIFYAKQVFGAMNIVKKVAHAIWYPLKAANEIKKAYQAATANTYTKVQAFVTGIKRFFLFGTVVANSVVGQGVGASQSHAAVNTVSTVMPENNKMGATASIGAGISLASGMANANGVYQGTRGVGFFSKQKKEVAVPKTITANPELCP